jgi:hypothetical protein
MPTFRLHLVAAVAASCLSATHAMAQMPPDIAAKIAALGRVVAPGPTAAIYGPLQEKEPYSGIKVARDVKCGPDERNLVDIFSADGAGAPRPVLMFVHGGAYVAGNKHPPGSPFYDNVMVWAARHGMVGVNVEYRLAPKNPWPAAQEDLASAVRYVAAHASDYGARVDRIFLMGHSAGAAHVAIYVSHPQFFGPNGSGLAGAIFSSDPIYDLSSGERSEGRSAYFGSDTSLYAERSALPGLIKGNVPFMFSAAELDPPEMVEQFNKLREAMCNSPRGCMRSILLPKHSHMSESYSINTADTLLSDQILAFMETGK